MLASRESPSKLNVVGTPFCFFWKHSLLSHHARAKCTGASVSNVFLKVDVVLQFSLNMLLRGSISFEQDFWIGRTIEKKHLAKYWRVKRFLRCFPQRENFSFSPFGRVFWTRPNFSSMEQKYSSEYFRKSIEKFSIVFFCTGELSSRHNLLAEEQFVLVQGYGGGNWFFDERIFTGNFYSVHHLESRIDIRYLLHFFLLMLSWVVISNLCFLLFAFFGLFFERWIFWSLE